LLLFAVYPGVEVAEVKGGIGWQLRCAGLVSTVDPPTENELYLLRQVLDPQRLYLKR
jgi:glutaconate CoA-transferase, subunit B